MLWQSRVFGGGLWGARSLMPRRNVPMLLLKKRIRRHVGHTYLVGTDEVTLFPCGRCGKICHSRIGLYSHSRVYESTHPANSRLLTFSIVFKLKIAYIWKDNYRQYWQLLYTWEIHYVQMTEEDGAKFIRQLSDCALKHRRSYTSLNKRYLVHYWIRSYEP